MRKLSPDRLIRQLANLQFAIGLLFVIGIVIALGTFIEQDQSLSFYQQNYPQSQPILGFLTWDIITFCDLDHIQYINIKNNRIIKIDQQAITNLISLLWIYSDVQGLCCNLPITVLACSPAISSIFASCDNLLGNLTQQYLIWMFCVKC